MKTFVEFITECYFLLSEEEKKGRSGPKYNYEVALVNLYNHLTKSDDKANNRGKILRGLVSRGDTEELTDFLAKELNAVKNDEKHPLHFSNIGDEGFSGGKKTEDHRDSYYGELEDQFYTFLNDSQSKLGKRLISQGYTVKRLGDDKIPLSKSGKTAYGKESDTSKADIVFQHPTRPERENYTSLKKASGAVSASAGADETAGNYTVGMRTALQLALKSGRITKDQAKKLEAEGNTRISVLKDAMSSSKGMSKEQQKDLLPQLDKLRGSVEELIPGTERETAKAQLSGIGKYEKAVDSFISTGRGGGRKRNPEEVSGVNQRMRLGKGTTKTREGPVQRPVTSTGDIKPPTTGEPSTFSDFSKQAAQSQKELSKADRELEDANDELEASSVPIDPNTKKPVFSQFRKNIQGHMAADPTSRTSRLNMQRRRAAEVKLTNAQSNRDNAAITHDATVSAAQQAQQQQSQPEPQQVQQIQPTQQAPVEQPPVPTEQPPAPKVSQQAPQPTQQVPTEQPPAPQEPQQVQQQPKPEQKKKKKERTDAEKEDTRVRMDAAGQAQGLPN